jgi:energy-coupling factor transport system substrate-specific component
VKKKDPAIKEKKPYLSNQNLLVIAVLSGIGGVMSTYIGYLGNLFNAMLGVPFGAGQFLSGLHVFWIILAAGLVKKPGAASLAGLLKGCIEFFTGGTHGITIIIVSLVQGIIVDLVLIIFRKYSLTILSLAGGLAAASNVLVFQTLYFSGVAWGYIAFIAFFAFVSGIIFAGFFGRHVLNIIFQAKAFQLSPQDHELARPPKNSKFTMAAAGIIFLIFTGGAVYYFTQIYTPPWSGPQCTVEGAVERSLSFRLSDFSDQETTITAELKGQYTHVEEKEYTGIPVSAILKEAVPKEGSTILKVTGTDGYEIEFSLEKILVDDKFILIEEDDMLRLVAGNYEGSCWVRNASRMIID